MKGGHNALDLAGMRFGRLTVVDRAPRPPVRGPKYVYWRALCDCGASTVVRSSRLVAGDTQSCGCLREERRLQVVQRHGQTKTKTWKVWSGMWERCINANSPSFRNYGGRGIRVCDRWRVFENFLADMGIAPVGMSLDRINNDGHYEPDNCRWADVKTQAWNRRTSLMVDVGGRRVAAAELAASLGLSPGAMRKRLLSGWPVEIAVTEPPRTNRRRP